MKIPRTFNCLKQKSKKEKKCCGATVTQLGQSVLGRLDGSVPVTTDKTTTLNTSLNAADANTAYFQFRFRCFGEITVSLDRILPSRWVRCFGCQTFQLFINSYFCRLWELALYAGEVLAESLRLAWSSVLSLQNASAEPLRSKKNKGNCRSEGRNGRRPCQGEGVSQPMV